VIDQLDKENAELLIATYKRYIFFTKILYVLFLIGCLCFCIGAGYDTKYQLMLGMIAIACGFMAYGSWFQGCIIAKAIDLPSEHRHSFTIKVSALYHCGALLAFLSLILWFLTFNIYALLILAIPGWISIMYARTIVYGYFSF
jgi:hypothetical protein